MARMALVWLAVAVAVPHAAEAAGHHPEIILAGLRINDGVGDYVAAGVDAAMTASPGRVLVLGLTFKENVPDLRNSKVIDVIQALQARGHGVDVFDPHAGAGEAKALYGIDLLPNLDNASGYDALIGAVRHGEFEALGAADISRLVGERAVVADIKGMWRTIELPGAITRWQL